LFPRKSADLDSNMKVTQLHLEGAITMEPTVYSDDRGYFFESYNAERYKSYGIPEIFLQDNQSFSAKGVLRGLHFQNPPYEQGKLVRVIQGSVLDVIVDIRKKSATYGEHVSVKLDDIDQKMLWIPPGFAHGFVSLEANTIFVYKCTKVYNKTAEGGIIWNDPDLNINWNVSNPLVSEKDLELGIFKNLNSVF